MIYLQLTILQTCLMCSVWFSYNWRYIFKQSFSFLFIYLFFLNFLRASSDISFWSYFLLLSFSPGVIIFSRSKRKRTASNVENLETAAAGINVVVLACIDSASICVLGLLLLEKLKKWKYRAMFIGWIRPAWDEYQFIYMM